MITSLEEEWQEQRNISTLFPEIYEITSSNPIDAFIKIKENNNICNNTLAETIDAAWWCMYGMLYSDENERDNSLPHDEYFYNVANFKNDVEMLCKCEMIRTELGIHRYPVPKKKNNAASRKKIKIFTDYKDFVKSTMSLFSEQLPEPMRGPEAFKMTVDMMRSQQEKMIFNGDENSTDKRKEQFIAIGNLIDDVFIHRGYVKKVKDECAELFTPEQVEEWETIKYRIKNKYASKDVPKFVLDMLEHPSFVLKRIE